MLSLIFSSGPERSENRLSPFRIDGIFNKFPNILYIIPYVFERRKPPFRSVPL